MSSKEILKYFDDTEGRETRDDLRLAAGLVKDAKVAIDCGCGAGSDIAFLLSEGFQVHAFDIEAEAVERCRKRFGNDKNVRLSQATFSTFGYPDVSLIVADASLFFCPEDELDQVWRKITGALSPDGVFVGSFLGAEDTMAGPDYDKASYWPDVLVVSEEQVKDLFMGFRIESFTEHKTSGAAPDRQPHQWHIYSVVARKESSNGN